MRLHAQCASASRICSMYARACSRVIASHRKLIPMGLGGTLHNATARTVCKCIAHMQYVRTCMLSSDCESPEVDPNGVHIWRIGG